MILLGLVPFVFGYYFAKVVLKEEDWRIVFALSVSAGLALFLFGVNVFSKFFQIKTAVYLTALLMFILCWVFYFYKNKVVCMNFPKLSFNKTETLINNIIIAGIIAYTVIFLFLMIDDDYFIHFPLVGLLVKGNPFINPIFPDLIMKGHYGRNLLISSFTILTSLHPFMILYILIPLLQVSTYFLILFTASRQLKNSTEALFAAAFAFFAVNTGFSDAIIRAGLVELIHNNNPLVYNFLFLIVYFLFRCMFEKKHWMDILCAVLLGAYALVYETHYVLLGLTLLLFPFLIWFLRKKISWEYLTKTIIIFMIALFIASFQGGPITDLVKSKFIKSQTRQKPVDRTEVLFQGVNQKVEIKFPKKEFKITTYAGKDISIFSKKFLKDQGFSVYLFPICFLFLLFTRNLYGMFFGFFGLFALMMPVMVDFGRFNSESLRFLCAAGLGFSIALGICSAKALNFLRSKIKGEFFKALAICGFLVFLGFNFALSIERVTYILGRAVLMPQDFQININEKILSYSKNKNFTNLDLLALKKLNELSQKGDRFIANPSYQTENDEAGVIMTNLMITGLTGCGSIGCGLKMPKKDWRMLDLAASYGFRGRAFWNTFDPAILEDMKVKWIYLFRNCLNESLYRKLKNEKSYLLLYSFKDQNQIREIYEVIHKTRKNETSTADIKKLKSLKVTGLYLPSKMLKESFYLGKIEIANISTMPEEDFKKIKLFYRIYDLSENICVDYMDEIKQTMETGLKNLYFVTPYEKGRYEIKFYLQVKEGEFIKLPASKDFIVEI